MVHVIKAGDLLSPGEIQRRINACEEYDVIAFDGFFRFDNSQKKAFTLGKEIIQSIIMVTRANLTLDFSNARIEFCTDRLNGKLAFLYLYPTARNVRLVGLNLQIVYTGENSNRTFYGIYNSGHSLNVDRCRLEIYANKQLSVVGICNYGGLNTHLDTPADNLSLTNSRIRIMIQPEDCSLNCDAYGVYNYYANSAQIADTFIEVKNKGVGEEQRAIGIYNNGRFCRFTANNVKANGSHNKGLLKEEAHAVGMLDEGMYSLISNCNIVGEWGGKCTGLWLKGEFTKVTGNKILSTHTIQGTTVKIEGIKTILSDNILTSTSRNARLVASYGDTVTVSGNILEALMALDECVSGVGVYVENGNAVIVSHNQILPAKTCGIFSKNSTVTARDNLFLKEGRPNGFRETVADDGEVARRLDEGGILSLYRPEI